MRVEGGLLQGAKPLLANFVKVLLLSLLNCRAGKFLNKGAESDQNVGFEQVQSRGISARAQGHSLRSLTRVQGLKTKVENVGFSESNFQ